MKSTNTVRNEIHYAQVGEYQLPLLILSQTDDTEPLGKYGRMRLAYLKNQRPVLYNRMLLNGTLWPHLQDVQKTAYAWLERTMTTLLDKYPAPDKERAQLLWVAHMNGLKAQAEEVVVREIMYAERNHASSCLSIQTWYNGTKERDTMSPIEVPAKIQLVEKRETRTSRGMLSKGWYHVDGQLVMVKGNSITEAGTAGYEPYSEVMASLIAQVLGLPHVEYALMPAKLFPDIQTYSCDVVSVCPLFVKPGDQLYHFADLADAHFLANGQTPSPEALFQYAVELYGKKWLYQMLAFDAFIGNEDRHENNIDIIVRHYKHVLPPLYDNGGSLLAWATDEELTDTKLRYQFDKAKPFRSRHAQQIKLLDEPVLPTRDLDELYSEIIQSISPILALLSEKRASAIRQYLKYRLHYLKAAMG